MNEPKFTGKLIDRPSSDLIDEIYNTEVDHCPWHIAIDACGQKYAVAPFVLSSNCYGSYAISCEDFDPCRIAWERGEMNRDEFWERFGYLWRLEPLGRGEMSVVRYSIHRTQDIVTFMAFRDCNSPIELMEEAFQNIFNESKLTKSQFQMWKRRYQRFRAAVAAREKQLIDAELPKPAS
jgi:hypothetical protein